MHVFWCMYVLIFVGYVPGNGIARPEAMISSALVRIISLPERF